MKTINLLLRFLLELAALTALGYWGFHASSGVTGILLCIVAPLFFAVIWGLFAANKAKFPPSEPWKALLGVLLLEVTALILAVGGHPIWAGIIAMVILVNSGLVYWRKYQ